MTRTNIKIKLQDISPCGLSSAGPFSSGYLIDTRAFALLNVGPLMLKYCIQFADFPSFIDFSRAGTSCQLLDALDKFSNQLDSGEALLETDASDPDEANQAKFNYLLMLLSNGCLGVPRVNRHTRKVNERDREGCCDD